MLDRLSSPARCARAAVLIALAATTLLAGTAIAAPADEYQDERPQSRAMAARWLGRLGLLSIRSIPQPEPQDYEIVANLLRLASEIDPDNLDLRRREIEAWFEADRRDEVLRATGELVTKDPKDEVAQLRLISARIEALQSVEERLAAYDRLLGPAGQRLDAAVRSRLALDAALLAREFGREERFVELLTRATTLDSANKDAAALVATYVLDRTEDPMARAEILLNLVLADPMDSASHMNLSRELRSHGAFEAAARFLNNALALSTAAGGGFELLSEQLVNAWLLHGAEEALSMLDQIESARRNQRRAEIEMAQQMGQQPPQGLPPDIMGLPTHLEPVRVAANLALGRRDAAAASVRNFGNETALTQAIAQQLQNPQQRRAADQQIVTLALEWTWLRLWAGIETDVVEQTLEGLASQDALSALAQQRFDGWLAFRKGDTARARELLSPIADRDPRARLGLGAIAESEGQPREAARHYAMLALRQQGTMLGAFARTRVESILGTPIAPSREARELEQYVQGIPAWLDRMVRDPRDFMVLDVQFTQPRLGPADGLPVEITLRNIGRLPLATGANAPMSTRLLLSPELTIASQAPQTGLRPEVVDIARQLRLDPGESVSARADTGLGMVGLVLDTAALRPAQLRWLVIQDFQLNQHGRFIPGPHALTTNTGRLTRTNLPLSATTPDALAQFILASQSEKLLEALLAARDAVAGAATQGQQNPQLVPLGEAALQAVTRRYPTLSPLHRALVVLLVVSAAPQTENNPLDALVREDDSELVTLSALLTRGRGPDDPLFEKASRMSPETARFASALRERILRSQERARAAQQQEQGQQGQQGRPQQGQQPRNMPTLPDLNK